MAGGRTTKRRWTTPRLSLVVAVIGLVGIPSSVWIGLRSVPRGDASLHVFEVVDQPLISQTDVMDSLPIDVTWKESDDAKTSITPVRLTSLRQSVVEIRNEGGSAFVWKERMPDPLRIRLVKQGSILGVREVTPASTLPLPHAQITVDQGKTGASIVLEGFLNAGERVQLAIFHTSREPGALDATARPMNHPLVSLERTPPGASRNAPEKTWRDYLVDAFAIVIAVFVVQITMFLVWAFGSPRIRRLALIWTGQGKKPKT